MGSASPGGSLSFTRLRIRVSSTKGSGVSGQELETTLRGIPAMSSSAGPQQVSGPLAYRAHNLENVPLRQQERPDQWGERYAHCRAGLKLQGALETREYPSK